MKFRIMLLKKYGQKGKFYFINSDGQGLEKNGCLGYFQFFFRSLAFLSDI